MNKLEYLKYHSDFCEKMKEVTKRKNSDYTGDSDNPFANFQNSEAFAGVDTERGFLVRMGDKISRIKSFIEKGTLEVKDESVEDTLLDICNYSILLAAYIKSKR